jgi:arabinofuranan 3-O-arabinosyltransferase
MLGSRSWVCNPLLEVQGEDGGTFDRVFTASASGEYRITGTALLTGLKTIEQYTTLRPPKVSASSASVEHPANMGRSAFDGDRATTWISNPLDRQPALTVDFGRKVTLSRLKFIFPNEITQRPMTQVGVAGAKALRSGWLDQSGAFNFAPVTTDKLIIKFLVGGSPVQITDIEIPGVKPLGPPPGLPLRTACGAGPTFQIAGTGQRVLTRLVGGTVADLAQGHPVPYESCGRVPLFAGEQRLYVGVGDPFRIANAVVRPVDALRAPAVRDQPMEVNTWTPEHRSVSVSTTSESYLVVNDNYNAGWRAVINGEQLRSVRLDGWRQAWVLPKNTEGAVEMTYEPDRWYRGGLLLGFLLILSLVLLASVPARRDELVRAPALRPGRIAPRWAWALAPALGFWAGGFYGLAGTTAMVGLLAAARRYERRSPLAARLAAGVRSPFVAGGLFTLAAGSSALGTLLATQERYGVADGFRDVLPQLLCLPLIGFLVWTLCRPAPSLAALPAVNGRGRPGPGLAVRPGAIPSAWGPPPGEPPPSAWGPTPGPLPPRAPVPVREPVGSTDGGG